MYFYTVSDVADALCFLRTCSMIDSALPGLEKISLIANEAGMIQTCRLENKTITITNDCRKNCVFVESDMDLSRLFS